MRTPLVIVGLLLASALASCGGSDGDGDGNSIALAEFIDQANAICEKGNADLEEGALAISSEAEAVAYVVDDLIPSVREQIEDIRAIGTPDDKADEIDAALDETLDVLDEIEDDPAAAIASDDPFADVNTDLTEIGLTECGSG